MNKHIAEVINLLTELGWNFKIEKGTLQFVFRQEIHYMYHDITGEIRVESTTYSYPPDDFVKLLRYSLIKAYQKVEDYED